MALDAGLIVEGKKRLKNITNAGEWLKVLDFRKISILKTPLSAEELKEGKKGWR